MTELCVLIDEEPIGSIHQEAGGRLRFVYNQDWRNRVDAVPLSLSMPLGSAEHPHRPVEAFLWNLLPDREDVLRQIAQEHGISSRNAFALAGVRGEDLPGAIQIIPPERIPHLRRRERVVRISEVDLAELLQNRLRAVGRTHIGEDSGFFSLAGAQAKLAVCYLSGRWYEQRGYTPSTHIVKPSIPGLQDQVENEHFCLRLGEAVGLPVVKSEVRRIGDLVAIVVERYDRVRIAGRRRLPLAQSGGRVLRIHQEDMCSALAVHPANKYQHLGGPGIKRIMQVLEGSGAPATDRERFMRACAFNYVIAGIDAHAKNYSVLIEGGGRFRLAQLYDVMSALCYDTETYNRLAMSVGGQRKYQQIFASHWERTARECRYDREAAVAHVREYIQHIPDAAHTVLAACRDAGYQTDLIIRLTDALAQRCSHLRLVYE
jgi:serine/threonine-protein kinase HipA